jgi:DNA polymerase
LDLFRANAPIYERMASLIFHKPEEQVSKDERFIGKQSVLGCSYNMGRPKFRGTCESYGFTPPAEMVEAYKPRHAEFIRAAVAKTRRMVEIKFNKKGVAIPAKFDNEDYYRERTMKENNWNTLDPQTDAEWSTFAFDDLADRAVTTWRENNPKIVAAWRELDDAAKAAIQSPGTETQAGKMKFRYLDADILGFPCLGMCLPSGHYLIYPHASVEKNESRGWGTQIRFHGVIPNSGGKWGWCYTYGGKLLENATQATAGDVMREGMLAAEAEGFQPFMLVHDEMLAIQKEGQTHERLCELLCKMPKWADGLPLAAEGSTIPFYKK